MTRKLQNPSVEDGRSRKRILKPVVEKKRRDRINQSLAELRSLLLNRTSDPRLQNPKIEKAEILDLVVEYLQKWTDGKKRSNDSPNGQTKTRAPVLSLHHSESSLPPPFSIQGAGFQQCMSHLSSYMSRVTPAQRTSLIEGLKHHTEKQQRPDFNQNTSELQQEAGSADESSRTLLPSLSPFQPHSCSTPSHDYLSPPSSPWFSPSFSTYATSPPFPSFSSHFSFPPSLSPPSTNTSFFSFSPTAPHTSPAGTHFPPPWAPRPSPHLVPREGSTPNSSSSVWRPWF
ncbi:hairy-related 11 [Limanda limanda]|uniref:hairy-related 11 n=1 Tax=Limanda limanda TaxID=27771 RepID=UPI0029C71CBA|nr:hairy-related 11 [Limanda limanda]